MDIISLRANGSTSNIERVFLSQDAAAANPGDGITGLSHTSSGLSISVIANVDASPTVDTSAVTSSIETIATLGTYATPTAGFVRFKEIDSTNMPGWYEIQWEDSVYSVTNAKMLSVSIKGVTNLADFAGQINLDVMDAAAVRDAIGMASANMDTQLSTIDTVVDTIAATGALTSDIVVMQADIDIIDANIDNLNLGIIYGTVQTGTLSTTQATTDLTGYLDSELIGGTVVFTGGTADGQRSNITAYASSGGLLTFTERATAPVAGDTFKVV